MSTNEAGPHNEDNGGPSKDTVDLVVRIFWVTLVLVLAGMLAYFSPDIMRFIAKSIDTRPTVQLHIHQLPVTQCHLRAGR